MAAAAVFAVAFLVRLAVGAQLADEPLFRSPQLDSLQYYLWAQRIAAGDFLWPVPPPHGLGYPVFLGALLALLDGSLGAVRVAQSLLGAGTCALAAAVAGRAFGRRAGIAAGLLLAVYGPLVWIDVSILAEGLLLFLLVLALWIVSGGDRPVVRAVLAGLVIALATLVRPTAVVLLPGLVAALVTGRLRDRRAWGAAGLLLATFFLVATPVVWKISQANGAFVPVQGHSGFAFYIGNHPDGDGLPSPRIGRGWEEIETEALRAGIEDPAAQDRYYRTRALAAMRERPGDSLRLFASKAFWLIQAAEVRDSHSFDFFRSRSGLLQVLPGFGLLFALAAAGLVAAIGRPQRPPLSILLGLAGFAAVTVLTMVGTRYRMPLIPFLAILAGPAVAMVVEAAKARRWRNLGVLALVFVITWGITHIRSYPPSLNFAEELAMSGSSLEKQEDWTGALAAYEQSLAADGGYVPALEGIGRTRIKQNDFQGAEEVLRRALQIKPGSQRAHHYLGIVLAQTGRPDEAVRELRASLALAPNDLPTLEALAPLLLARGEVDAAADAYARLLAINPNDAAGQLAMARLAGARNDPAGGLPAARRAVELAPENPEAWLVLARLAIDTGDAATAESALQRVDGLIGRSHPLVAQTWEMLYRLQGR
jgi:tetratricopeptide (TPR) repeat protein